MEPTSTGGTQGPTETDSHLLMIAQYQTLREEILKRLETEHQLVGLAIIAAGTILVAGVQSGKVALILLLPPIIVFLAATWAQSDRRIRQMAQFIRSQIEARADQGILWWETYMGTGEGRTGSLNLVAVHGVFVGIEVMATLLGLSLSQVPDALRSWYLGTSELVLDPLIMGLLVVDVLSIVLTILFLRRIPQRGLHQLRPAPKQ